MGIWLALSPKLKLYALMALVFIAAILKLRSDAVNNALLLAKAASAEKRLDAIRKANEVEYEIETMGDVYLADRARNWVRENDSDT
tara:strand:- start:250 stop:507 length:258 start_codon:yes stop_codon:yes gene_type:complete